MTGISPAADDTEPPVIVRQALFIAEHLVSANAMDAYREAGYSAKTADANAALLMENHRVAAAIDEGQKKRARQLEIEANDVLERFWLTATANPADLTMHHIGAHRYLFG